MPWQDASFLLARLSRMINHPAFPTAEGGLWRMVCPTLFNPRLRICLLMFRERKGEREREKEREREREKGREISTGCLLPVCAWPGIEPAT